MKLKIVYIFIFLALPKSTIAQNTDFVMKAGLNQNLSSLISPSYFIGLSHKVNYRFLQFEFGINIFQTNIKSSSTSNLGIPMQIGEHFQITELISEEILIFEYSSFPIGISINSKKKFSLGIGIEPILQIQQSRKHNQKLVNIFNEIVSTETSYEKIDFTPYNLEIYYSLNIPISKRIHVIVFHSHGIIKLNENQYIGGYVGRRQNSLKTKRISVGLSYSI